MKTAAVQTTFSTGLSGWVVGEGDPAVVSGKLAMPVDADNPIEIHWPTSLDLTNSYLFARAAPDLNDTTYYRMLLTGADGHVGFVVVGPNPTALRFRLKQTGVAGLVDTHLDYDPVAHAWWRVREAGGVLFWDTSTDGQAWVNQRVARHSIDLSRVTASVEVGAHTLEAGFGKGLFGIGNPGFGD